VHEKQASSTFPVSWCRLQQHFFSFEQKNKELSRSRFYRENTAKLVANIQSVFSYPVGGCGKFGPAMLVTATVHFNMTAVNG